MVSKARLDLPLPLGPVTTVNFPSGRSRSIPLRLFWRAPRISMQSSPVGMTTRFLFPIFEPTGDFLCESSSSQISIAASLCEASCRVAPASPTGRRLQFEPFGQLLALFLQFFRHHAA